MKTAQWRAPKWLVPTITFVIAVAFGIITYRQGKIESPDTKTYSAWADTLISSNFNYLRMVRNINFVVPTYLYSGWLTVVALFKLALGPAWPKGIVIFNYCLTLLVVWGTLNLVKQTSGSAPTLLLTGALLLIAYDLFNWLRFVLSDTSFMAIVFAVYYLLCRLVSSTKGHSLSALKLSLCIALVIVALIYRPTGAPVVLVCALVYLTKRIIGNRYGVERTRAALLIAVGLCMLGVVAIVFHAHFMKEPSSWPFPFASKWIYQMSEEYHQGYVVFQRPETYASSPGSLFDYILITLKKLIYFFSFLARDFSFAHKAINLAFFVPAYLLALVAVLNLFRGSSRLATTEWWAGWIALLWLLSFALFHAAQQIDYDWRYRLPCLPPLIVLSSIGFSGLTRDNRIVERVLRPRE